MILSPQRRGLFAWDPGQNHGPEARRAGEFGGTEAACFKQIRCSAIRFGKQAYFELRPRDSAAVSQENPLRGDPSSSLTDGDGVSPDWDGIKVGIMAFRREWNGHGILKNGRNCNGR